MANVIGTFATGAMSKIGDFVHKGIFGNTVEYHRPPEQPSGMNAHPAKAPAMRTPQQSADQGKLPATNPSKASAGTTFGKGWGP